MKANELALKDIIQIIKPDFDFKTIEGFNPEEDDINIKDEVIKHAQGVLSFEDCGPYFECGSAEVEDTPKALYRLLYYFGVKDIDFISMYKQQLFYILSTDRRFGASIEFFKYEIGIYFFCLESDHDAAGFRGVISNLPGSDNGVKCKNSDGIDFFNMIVALANTPAMIYHGNNFIV